MGRPNWYEGTPHRQHTTISGLAAQGLPPTILCCLLYDAGNAGAGGVPGRRPHAANTLSWDGGILGGAKLPHISAGAAALVIGFAVGVQPELPAVSAFGAIYPESL
jgi:hypothetical protein